MSHAITANGGMAGLGTMDWARGIGKILQIQRPEPNPELCLTGNTRM